MNLILASASARRKEILENAGFKFTVYPMDIDETTDMTLPPEIVCETLARRKAESAAGAFSRDAIVIGSDTIVFSANKIYGKPADEADAVRMLEALSGTRHFVYSGIAVCHDGKTVSGYDLSEVVFKEISREEIDFYVSRGYSSGKAGAYGIQDYGAFFAEKTIGDYLSIVGFPLYKMGCLLLEGFGIKTWELCK